MIEATSLGDLLKKQAEIQPDNVAFLSPDKGGFRKISYGEFSQTVRRYCGALTNLGLSKGSRAAIMSENCVEWAFFDWACSSLGIVTVPIYPSLPSDQALYLIEDSGATLVVAGAEQLAKVKGAPGVKCLLLTGAGSLDDLAGEPGIVPGEPDSTLQPDDLFTIIYTSGTTGQPKGAMLPHRAALHVCRAAMKALELDNRDLFLSFLPMSHVYERIAGQCLPIAMGGTIAFSKNLASLMGDIQRAKPTIMLCVPRFLEAFHDRVMDAVKKEPPIKRKIFALALSQGVRRAKGQFAPLAGILDKLAFEKIRERTGGRLRFFVSGGAALPNHLAEFLMATRIDVLQGYGLTETSGGTVVNRPDANKYWTVGIPLEMEVRIADDGEILVRGPALMLGYYNRPDDTAAAIDIDGWFHTGDIGEFHGEFLQITDRKKDLIVLANGKNVAPQPIENKLRASSLIGEAVVFGDSRDHCVALIVPNAEAVRGELELPEQAILSDNPQVHKLIKREIDGVNKTLAPFEMVKKFALLDQPFSIEGGELTPTLKVKRKVVKERYRVLLDSLK